MNTTTLKKRLATKSVEATASPHSQSDSSQSTITEYAALNNNALEIIEENLKKQPMSLQLFDIVKAPTGGSTVFTVPGISGDETVKSLTGIILDYTTPRAYWDTPDPVEGTPPICFSEDSIVSHDGKSCRECPYNDFGSRDGESNAKACKESVVLFLLRPDNIMPLVVRVPASSKRIFQRYVTRLIGKMIRISGVVTRITLEKKTNRTGQPYAVYNFEAIDELDPEESENARFFGRSFMEKISMGDCSATPIKTEG